MKKTTFVWSVTYLTIIIGLFFAVSQWFDARSFVPETPEPAPLNRFSFNKPETKFSLNRYQRLLDGELFFEKEPEQVTVIPFQSQLKIFGIISGKNSRAIVGLNGDPTNTTWIVKPGDQVAGEQIVAIGSNYIKVKNSSGEGKVEYVK